MKIEMPLHQARRLADSVLASLSPACERIEIAGSVRRKKPTIGDIEIVVIPSLCPDLEAQLSLFGDPPKMVSALDLLLDNLVRHKDHFRRGDKNGPLFKNFLVEFNRDGSEIGLDLFLTTPEQWGYILALRTGPGDFNQAWVTQKSKGGLLPDEYNFSGGWLYRRGKRIPTPEESDVFRLIGDGKVIPPEQRDNWRWRAVYK